MFNPQAEIAHHKQVIANLQAKGLPNDHGQVVRLVKLINLLGEPFELLIPEQQPQPAEQQTETKRNGRKTKEIVSQDDSDRLELAADVALTDPQQGSDGVHGVVRELAE